MDKIIELEDEELWREQKTPETEDDFLSSNMEMDIWTVLGHSRMTQTMGAFK